MLNFYHAEKQEVLQVLHSDQTAGLTEEQVREARSRYGENKLKEKKKKTMLQRFLDQFMHMNDYNKITALYSRLSVGDEDRDGGESNSIQNHDVIYKGWITPPKITS